MKRTRKAPPRSATKLSDHISELRWRILACLIALAIGGGITYVFRDEVFQLLQLPLSTPLYYTTPGGSFSFIMRYCTIGAIIALVPMLVYQLIMFVRPAFPDMISRRRVYLTSLVALLLALAGAAFGFGVILPAALHFFAGFEMQGLQSLISADSYLSLVTKIVITFAIAFQIPLIMTFIDHIKPLKPRKLFALEKWVILASLIVSVLVPFSWDMMTSLLIAAPIVVLYNFGIIGVMMQHTPAKIKQRRNAKPALEDLSHEKIAELMQPEKLEDAIEPETTPEDGAPEPETVTEQPPIKIQVVAPSSVTKAIDGVSSSPLRPAPRLVPPQRSQESPQTLPVRPPVQTSARGQLITDITPYISGV